MFLFKIYSLLLAVVIAGRVNASHIKRHHFPARNQCRPRLTATSQTASLFEISATPSHPSSLFRPSQSSLPSQLTHISASTKASSTTSPGVTVTGIPAPVSSQFPATSSHSSAVIEASQSHATKSTSGGTTATQIPATTTKHAASSTSSTVGASSVQKPVATPAVNPQASSLVPNSIKAGIAGGDAYPYMQDYIGWWYDWSADPSKPGTPIAVPMLWGNGTVDQQDADRLAAFERISTDPPFVLGFEEPDCPSGDGSSGMTVKDGVNKWESLIAPMKAKGTKLGSPSMCKQADETWLAQFQKQITTSWDFTAIHINKNSLDGVKKDIDHYMTYGKPIWVTEFACVDDHDKFEPCTNQDEINDFINTVVPFFQGNSNVYAYAYSNGLGLGDVWPLMKDGSLSESGKTYLAAISEYN